MKPARYIFLNQGLEMSSGKCGAQCAHAEMLAMHDYWANTEYRPKIDPVDRIWLDAQYELYKIWKGGGHYVKYVMKAEDSVQMYTVERYLEDRGFKTYLVIDEGRTEGTYMVPTAMAVELVDKDDERVASIFGEFRMYRDKPSQSNEPLSWNWRLWPWTREP